MEDSFSSPPATRTTCTASHGPAPGAVAAGQCRHRALRAKIFKILINFRRAATHFIHRT